MNIQDSGLPIKLEEEKSSDDLKAVRTLEDLKKLIILRKQIATLLSQDTSIFKVNHL